MRRGRDVSTNGNLPAPFCDLSPLRELEYLNLRGTRVTDKGMPAHATRQVKANQAWHEFNVDVWITNFNSIEFGFWRRERNKAKHHEDDGTQI